MHLDHREERRLQPHDLVPLLILPTGGLLETSGLTGGCSRKCKHEFCWMCMGLWSEHGTSWYNCSRYDSRSGEEARDAQAKSRQSLERYLHYYNRYANHEQSAKLDKDLYLKTEKKMTNLQTASGMSWIEVQFLETASQALQHCRQILKWTYAFAFYLQRNNLTEIFEDNQKDLEMAVESLSEMFEKPTADLADLKVDMMDKTAYCNKRRAILLSDTAESLKNSESLASSMFSTFLWWGGVWFRESFVSS